MQGILFKPDMHKAIRDKLKTQTRRLDHLKEINKEPDRYTLHHKRSDNEWGFSPHFSLAPDIWVKSRYRVGETVYIKEAYWEDSGDIYYKLDCPEMPTNMFFEKGKWKSPLFLPEIFARSFIKITDVKTERLQEITKEDIEAEGEPYMPLPEKGLLDFGYTKPYCYIKEHFAYCWDSINGKTYPFDGNPWVWRYCFNLIEDKQ